MSIPRFRILPAGDAALLVEVGIDIDAATNRLVHSLAHEICGRLREYAGIDVIAAYASLLVRFDPSVLTYEQVEAIVGEARPADSPARPVRRFTLPTLYGGDAGPDLEAVADYHGIPCEEVIRLHAGHEYPIYCIGFSPGFPYLGGLEPALHTPRLDTPRTRVPAGSVAIGGSQSGVYPTSTPGGWRIIGRTPAVLFEPRTDPPVLYRPGDLIRFISVSEDEFKRLLSTPRMPSPEVVG